MSSQIKADRKDYYRKLKLAQRGEFDVTPWLVWFLGCLSRTIESKRPASRGRAEEGSSLANNSGPPVNER